MSICAVTIESTDIERLSSFYRDGFALGEPSHAFPGHVGYTIEHGYIGFDAVDALPATPRPATTLWFRVDDAQAAHERLLALGGTSEMEPDATCSPGEVLAVVRDPDGNRVGLLADAS
jgi:predicted enzyme related to lactoylglutathione lyase